MLIARTVQVPVIGLAIATFISTKLIHAAPIIAEPYYETALQLYEKAGIWKVGEAKERLGGDSQYYPTAGRVNVYYYPGDNYTELRTQSNEAYYSYLREIPGVWFPTRNFTTDYKGRHGVELHHKEFLATPDFWFELLHSPVVDHACKIDRSTRSPAFGMDTQCITHEDRRAYQELLAEEGKGSIDTPGPAITWPKEMEYPPAGYRPTDLELDDLVQGMPRCFSDCLVP
ncbi:hypothetical protein BJ508DRAFT_301493 [Ascobolus immersus RN42]|uniref:Uncharacterized protein n=1 Tax=Ascobolus immersus RN42 TaxID=1160509 RepID=A0A3N4IYD7_ASCIM|nr:hypothetical protein BJ508DRAFT_301493 [Ascobolus immersus RN42]